MSRITNLLNQYGNSLTDIKSIFKGLPEAINPKTKLFTAAEAKTQYGIDLPGEDYILKLTPSGDGYTASYITPTDYEIGDNTVTTPEGKTISWDEFQQQLQPQPQVETQPTIESIPLTDDEKLLYNEYKRTGGQLDETNWLAADTPIRPGDEKEPEYQQVLDIFGKVFSNQDVQELLKFADDDPAGFGDELVKMGRNEDTEALLKKMFPTITDDEMEVIFNGPKIAGLSQSDIEYLSVSNPTGLFRTIKNAGKAEDTVNLLKYLLPNLTDSEVEAFFTGDANTPRQYASKYTMANQNSTRGGGSTGWGDKAKTAGPFSKMGNKMRTLYNQYANSIGYGVTEDEYTALKDAGLIPIEDIVSQNRDAKGVLRFGKTGEPTGNGIIQPGLENTPYGKLFGNTVQPFESTQPITKVLGIDVPEPLQKPLATVMDILNAQPLYGAMDASIDTAITKARISSALSKAQVVQLKQLAKEQYQNYVETTGRLTQNVPEMQTAGMAEKIPEGGARITKGSLYDEEVLSAKNLKSGESFSGAMTTPESKLQAKEFADSLDNGDVIENSAGMRWRVDKGNTGEFIVGLDDAGKETSTVYNISSDEARATFERSKFISGEQAAKNIPETQNIYTGKIGNAKIRIKGEVVDQKIEESYADSTTQAEIAAGLPKRKSTILKIKTANGKIEEIVAPSDFPDSVGKNLDVGLTEDLFGRFQLTDAKGVSKEGITPKIETTKVETPLATPEEITKVTQDNIKLGGGTPPEKPPVEPPIMTEPVPNPSPAVNPSPMAENVIGLRTIEPGLTRGEVISNNIKETLSPLYEKVGGNPMVEADPFANAALRERARVRVTIESNANILGTKAESSINKVFKLDKQGRIPELDGIVKDIPGAPTIADVAARYPLYESSLNAAQKEALTNLKKSVQPYYDLLTEVGIDIPKRSDVMDGGFYVPRGKATLEGADEPFKVTGGGRGGTHKGFEKPATFASQAEGIEKGYEYAPLGESLTSYAYDAGSRATDAHIVNYFKTLTDETGKLVGETVKMRMLREYPELVAKIDELKTLLNKYKSNLDSLTDRQISLIDQFENDPNFTDIDSLIDSLSNMTSGKSKLNRLELIEMQQRVTEELKNLKPEWDLAKRRAQSTPRDQSIINLPGLQGLTFPNEMANAANVILKKQGTLTGKGSEALGVIKAFNGLYAGVRATGDLSASFIQGLLASYSKPLVWAKAMRLQMESLFDEKAVGAFLNDFDKAELKAGRLTSSEWARAGTHYGGASGFFQSAGISSKIGDLPILKQANRAFSSMGDVLRLLWDRDQLAIEMGRGRTMAQIKASGDLERIASGANVMTGWTKTAAGGDIGQVVLFAPTWLQSRLEVVAKAGMGLRPGATLDQKMARMAILKMVAFGTALTVGINAALENDTDFRPVVDGKRNPKFMRIKYGENYYSLFGPWDSLVGAVINVGSGKPGLALRSMSSGLVSDSWDLVSGKDYNYNPVGSGLASGTKFNAGQFATWLVKSMIPFSAGQLPEGAVQTFKGIQEGNAGAAIAGGINMGSQILGIKSYPVTDYNTNAKKLGLPIYDEPTLLSSENPNYMMKNYYSDTLSGLGNYNPDEVLKSKDYADLVKLAVSVKQIKDDTSNLSNRKLISINADLSKGDTYKEFYQQWQKYLSVKDNPEELKAFLADKRNDQYKQGNMTQRQYVLLTQYNSLSSDAEKKKFLIDHPELNFNAYEDYLKKNPSINAQLAICGQADILTPEAYTEYQKLKIQYDIPDTALGDTGLPDNETDVKTYFDYQDLKDKYGYDDPEVQKFLIDNPSITKFLGKDIPTTPVEILDLEIKNRDLDAQYDVLDTKEAQTKFTNEHPDWQADNWRIEAYKDQFKFDKTVADKKIVDQFVSYKQTTDEEKDALRFKDINFYNWGVKTQGWKELPGLTQGLANQYIEYNKLEDTDDRKLYRAENKDFNTWLESAYSIDPLNIKSTKALQLQIKNKKLTDEYNAILEPAKKEQYLIDHPDYANDRLRVQAYNYNIPDNYIEDYVEYNDMPAAGYEQERWLKYYPEYYQNVYLKILGKEAINFDKVPSKSFEDAYNNEYLKLESGTPRTDYRKSHTAFNEEGIKLGKWKALTSSSKSTSKSSTKSSSSSSSGSSSSSSSNSAARNFINNLK